MVTIREGGHFKKNNTYKCNNYVVKTESIVALVNYRHIY